MKEFLKMTASNGTNDFLDQIFGPETPMDRNLQINIENKRKLVNELVNYRKTIGISTEDVSRITGWSNDTVQYFEENLLQCNKLDRAIQDYALVLSVTIDYTFKPFQDVES